MTNAWFIFKPVTVVKNNTWVKLSTNSVLDGTIIKVIVGNINVVKHVCNNLYEHFCSSNHNCFISDVSVTFIDKTDPSDPLKREDYRRSTLKTMAPFGLNIGESV